MHFVVSASQFPGRTMDGIGFDRGVLEAAGITLDSAVMAVTSGDNSNILIARVARETFGVQRVVARIYDPRRAMVYERLGIPTVASVAWTSARVLRCVLPQDTKAEWVDPTSTFILVERRITAGGAGRTIAQIAESGGRIALLTRNGQPQIPPLTLVLQEGDLVQLMVSSQDVDRIDAELNGTHQAGAH